MANPDPEITAEEVAEVRDDAIMATGRSDYPNQVNNVLGFPYIFRGALDVRATTINVEMKIAAAQALAELAREDVPDEVAAAYGGAAEIRPRLHHPGAVRSAPDFHGAARRRQGRDGYRRRPQADRRHGRLSPSAARAARSDRRHSACRCSTRLRRQPKRVVFAEGEEEQVIRAAASFVQQGLGTALLVGREDRVRETAANEAGIELGDGIEIINARAVDAATPPIAAYLYERLQRRGYLCATASGWSTPTAIISPPAWWRSATPTPW